MLLEPYWWWGFRSFWSNCQKTSWWCQSSSWYSFWTVSDIELKWLWYNVSLLECTYNLTVMLSFWRLYAASVSPVHSNTFSRTFTPVVQKYFHGVIKGKVSSLKKKWPKWKRIEILLRKVFLIVFSSAVNVKEVPYLLWLHQAALSGHFLTDYLLGTSSLIHHYINESPCRYHRYWCFQ